MIPFIYIGDAEIITHFILTLIGIFFGFLLLLYNIKNLDKKTKKSVLLLAIFIFIPFLIGGWLGYEIEKFLINKKICITKNNLFESFSLIWGLALATAIAFPVAKFLKINIWETADYFSISIASGGIFVKLGCFFNGCCFGIPAPDNFPFVTYYPYNSYPQILFRDAGIYPSQLFESIAWLFIFIFLLIRKKKKLFKGELIILLFLLFSIFRFFIEFTRFHITKSFLSTGQIFSLIILVFSIIIYIIKFNYYKLYKKLDKKSI